MALYTVKYGQTIYDIAVQEYGGVVGIEQILIDKPNIDLSTVLEAGSEIVITPNATNVINNETRSYFKNRSITSFDGSFSESEISSYVGSIVTNEPNSLNYINTNVWGSDSELRFDNTQPLAYNRVVFNRDISFEEDGDFFELEFSYSGTEDHVVVWSTTGASINISGGNVFVYADGGVFLGKTIAILPQNVTIKTKITSSLNIDGTSVTKGILLDVNGEVVDINDLGGNTINFNILAGNSNTTGLTGTIGKININSDVFQLLEGSGIYIYKTIWYGY